MRLITVLRMLGFSDGFPVDHRDDCPVGSDPTCECGFFEIRQVMDANVPISTDEIKNMKEALERYKVPAKEYQEFLRQEAHAEGYSQ